LLRRASCWFDAYVCLIYRLFLIDWFCRLMRCRFATRRRLPACLYIIISYTICYASYIYLFDCYIYLICDTIIYMTADICYVVDLYIYERVPDYERRLRCRFYLIAYADADAICFWARCRAAPRREMMSRFVLRRESFASIIDVPFYISRFHICHFTYYLLSLSFAIVCHLLFAVIYYLLFTSFTFTFSRLTLHFAYRFFILFSLRHFIIIFARLQDTICCLPDFSLLRDFTPIRFNISLLLSIYSFHFAIAIRRLLVYIYWFYDLWCLFVYSLLDLFLVTTHLHFFTPPFTFAHFCLLRADFAMPMVLPFTDLLFVYVWCRHI
jgi:hypothetical protein